MIHYTDIFNNKTLNIFTDASMCRTNNEEIGAPGYVAVIGDDIVHENIKILMDSTISESELYAVYMAIQYALLNRDKVKVINIFSDSQFAVYGLKEWIFNWMNNIRDDKLYNSSKKEVSHQSLFLNIIYTILYYNLEVSIYHNRGHFTENKVDEFIELFTKHNYLHDYIDIETAIAIMKYNNRIDKITRKVLTDTNQLPCKMEKLEYLARNDLDLNHYKKLLNI